MDDSETKELLEKELELAEENNKILKKIQRGMRVGNFFTILYWLFITGVVAGTYYFFQPLLDSFRDLFGAFSGGGGSIQGLEQIPEVQTLLKTLNIGQ